MDRVVRHEAKLPPFFSTARGCRAYLGGYTGSVGLSDDLHHVSLQEKSLASTVSESLVLDRCPHCSVSNPNLRRVHHFQTHAHDGSRLRFWGVYVCGTCGGVVTAAAAGNNAPTLEYHPQHESVDEDIPERPRAYLKQSLESLHAPAGAVMLAASSVDSMLKLKNYLKGSLYERIEKAVADGLMTKEMAEWAHAVRLDANDQRHADESATLPTEADAKRCIEFAMALGEFLFVLPQRIERGIGAPAS